jgi:hypothetical protein
MSKTTYAVHVHHEGSTSSAVVPATRKTAITRAKRILADRDYFPTLTGVSVTEVDAHTWTTVSQVLFHASR